MARGGRRSRRRRQAQAQPLPRPSSNAPQPRADRPAAAPGGSAHAIEIDAAGGAAALPRTTPPPPTTLPTRPQRAVPRPTTAPGQGRERGRLYRLTHPRLISEIVAELRKVVWPSRQETRNLTTVVVVIAVAVGAMLGGVDWVFNRVMENVLLN